MSAERNTHGGAKAPNDDRPSLASPLSTGDRALPLAEQVYQHLRRQVIHGEIRAGSRLLIRDIADAYGTSVMPVREAIRRLVEAGLATHEAYKGARVRGLSVEELTYAYDVRILVEGEAARLGGLAARPETADLMELHRAALERAVKAGDIPSALQADERLLDTLYACTGNHVMIDVIHGLWEKCLPYKAVWATSVTERNEPEAWHFKADLVDAVHANDGDRAQRIIHQSYRIAQMSIHNVLTEQG